MRRPLVFLALVFLGVSADYVSAAESGAKKAPRLNARVPEMFALNPAGSPRGASAEIEILGENLDGAERLEIDGTGVDAKILRSSHLRLTARVSVAADAPAGIRGIRLFSRLGVSNPLGFRVGRHPEVREQEPNDSREKAQSVDCPSIVDAVLFPDEDTDFYRFHAAAGQRLVLEVLSQRNGSGLDSEMYLLDASGARLRVADQEAGADPVIEHKFAKEGDYFAVIRGVFNVLNITFPTGHPAYTYQFRLSSPPVVESTDPYIVTPGGTVEATITGRDLASVTEAAIEKAGLRAKILDRAADRLKVALTADASASGIYEMRAVSPLGESAPLRFLVDPAIATVREPADRLPVPGAALGVIAAAGEVDHFRIAITEPGAYVFEVQAGRLNSMLDSVLSLVDGQGKELAKNDNGAFPEGAEGDSKIFYEFKQPGEYRLEIRQAVLDRHGPQYGYRLLARRARPGFSLTAVGGGGSQPWARTADRIIVHPASEVTIPVSVEWLEGLEHDGAEIRLTVEGIEPLLRAEPSIVRVKEGKYDAQSRFTAKASIMLSVPEGATLGNYRFRIHGESRSGGVVLSAGESVRVAASGRYVMSGTGGFPYSNDGQRFLAVVAPKSFSLRPEIGDERYPVRFTMQPGTMKSLTLSVLPPEKFAEGLRFAAENLPRGVGIDHVESSPDAKQYVLHLKAAADCELGWFPLVTFVATGAGGEPVPTTYFGIAVQ